MSSISNHPAGADPVASDRDLVVSLVLLTVVTGVVDAVSFLRLGHVFVANMTGNVVFLGFAAAGASAIDPGASVVAILAFLAGARIGALSIVRAGADRTRMLMFVTSIKAMLLILAVVIAALLPISDGAPARYVLAAVLALAMGAQNAVARKLAVPDLTTTVLTMTLTALGSGGPGTRRRLLAIGAMFFGALGGGLLVLRVNVAAALTVASLIVALVGIGMRRFARRSGTA